MSLSTIKLILQMIVILNIFPEMSFTSLRCICKADAMTFHLCFSYRTMIQPSRCDVMGGMTGSHHTWSSIRVYNELSERFNCLVDQLL
jgi:hypothetical protein